MGGLVGEERDNKVLIMPFWTNSKGEGHVLVAWWPSMSTPKLKNHWFDLFIQLLSY